MRKCHYTGCGERIGFDCYLTEEERRVRCPIVRIVGVV